MLRVKDWPRAEVEMLITFCLIRHKNMPYNLQTFPILIVHISTINVGEGMCPCELSIARLAVVDVSSVINVSHADKPVVIIRTFQEFTKISATNSNGLSYSFVDRSESICSPETKTLSRFSR